MSWFLKCEIVVYSLILFGEYAVGVSLKYVTVRNADGVLSRRMLLQAVYASSICHFLTNS